jgi:hypothetical protein
LLLPNGRSDPACSDGVPPPPIEPSFSLRIRNLYLSTTPRLFSHKSSANGWVNIRLLGRRKKRGEMQDLRKERVSRPPAQTAIQV